MRAARRALTGSARQAANVAAQTAIIELPRFRQAPQVALYRAFDGEVETEAIAHAARASGARVLYARVREGGPLDFIEASEWRYQGKLPVPVGVPHPLGGGDVLVVPGLGFDVEGHRLGFGAGHYDRSLAVTEAWPVGLAFALQRVERLPRAPHDLPVAALATDEDFTVFRYLEPQS